MEQDARHPPATDAPRRGRRRRPRRRPPRRAVAGPPPPRPSIYAPEDIPPLPLPLDAAGERLFGARLILFEEAMRLRARDCRRPACRRGRFCRLPFGVGCPVAAEALPGLVDEPPPRRRRHRSRAGRPRPRADGRP